MTYQLRQGAEPKSVHPVRTLTDKSSPLRAAYESALIVLADHGDTPLEVYCYEDGAVGVVGITHGVLFDDGSVRVAPLPEVATAPTKESALREKLSGPNSESFYEIPLGYRDFFVRVGDAPVPKDVMSKLKTAVVDALRESGAIGRLHATIRTELKKNPTVAAILRDAKLRLKESEEPMPKPTLLKEEDYAEIVTGDDGLDLVLNGEVIASEDCDLEDEADCDRAEAALTAQAEALGYVAVDEGTFDASDTKGGKVVNGDEQDDWQSGEGYYARRYRRRTSDATTGKPTQPALESLHATVRVQIPEPNAQLVFEHIVETAKRCAKSGVFHADRFGESGVAVLSFVTEAEAHAFRVQLGRTTDLETSAVERIAEGKGKIPPQFLKGKKKTKAGSDDEEDDDEDEEVPDDDEDDPTDDDEAGESLIDVARDFLAESIDPDLHLARAKEFDRLVLEGRYEEALVVAESLAIELKRLDEYKRRTGSSLSRFRRSLKQQTSQERTRNRMRRREYRSNAGLRRKSKVYRRRVKRFIKMRRRHESAEFPVGLAHAADRMHVANDRHYAVIGRTDEGDAQDVDYAIVRIERLEGFDENQILYRTDEARGKMTPAQQKAHREVMRRWNSGSKAPSLRGYRAGRGALKSHAIGAVKRHESEDDEAGEGEQTPPFRAGLSEAGGKLIVVRVGGAKITAVTTGMRGDTEFAKVTQVEDGEGSGVSKGDTIARKRGGKWYIADESDESAEGEQRRPFKTAR